MYYKTSLPTDTLFILFTPEINLGAIYILLTYSVYWSYQIFNMFISNQVEDKQTVFNL